MNSVIPVQKPNPQEPNLKLVDTKPQDLHRPSFSTPKDFALLLVPVILGVGYGFIRHGDGSFLFRLEVYSLFLFGLASALGVLQGISQLEKDG